MVSCYLNLLCFTVFLCKRGMMHTSWVVWGVNIGTRCKLPGIMPGTEKGHHWRTSSKHLSVYYLPRLATPVFWLLLERKATLRINDLQLAHYFILYKQSAFIKFSSSFNAPLQCFFMSWQTPQDVLLSAPFPLNHN